MDIDVGNRNLSCLTEEDNTNSTSAASDVVNIDVIQQLPQMDAGGNIGQIVPEKVH